MNIDSSGLPEIRILPENVANQIAAGEVIERPAAVVKELVENSIDARATRIEVEFKHGGKSFIKVCDNGHGMTPNQALLCLEPHATSKIRTHEDLNRVSSFGFRGEAIPSIASVSEFTLKTRTAGQASGSLVQLSNGRVVKNCECGMAVGTEIAVENLFSTVPARRKFLKTENIEASHIIRLCRLYALALPALSISLIENSKTLFKSEKNSDVIGRVDKIFGREISSKLMLLKPLRDGSLSVAGAVLKPGEFCAAPRNICVFINSRPVDLRAVHSALKEAYGNSIPRGKYAAAFLFIEMDPAELDVNVHPAKREVRLRNEFAVRNFLLRAILETIGGASQKISLPAKENQWAGAELKYIPPAVLMPPSAAILPEAAKPAPPKLAEPYAVLNAPAPRPAPSANPAPDWEFLAFYKKRYILFKTSKSLVSLSVNAALKRINYEKMLSALEGEKSAPSQALLIPLTLRFERAEAEFFESCLSSFKICGFDLEPFGRNYYRLSAIPLWLSYEDAESFVKDLVVSASDDDSILGRRKIAAETFAKLAFKRAHGARIPETSQSAEALLKELFSCKMPMLSPMGEVVCKELSAEF